MSSNYTYNTRNKVNDEGRKAKPDTSTPYSELLISPGKIIAVNGGGYDVGLVDEAGEISRRYDRVFAWPSGSTLSVDDEVWLFLPDAGENPMILVAGGGGTCYNSVLSWGILFG